MQRPEGGDMQRDDDISAQLSSTTNDDISAQLSLATNDDITQPPGLQKTVNDFPDADVSRVISHLRQELAGDNNSIYESVV